MGTNLATLACAAKCGCGAEYDKCCGQAAAESEEHAPVSRAVPGMIDLGTLQSLNAMPGSSPSVPAASAATGSKKVAEDSLVVPSRSAVFPPPSAKQDPEPSHGGNTRRPEQHLNSNVSGSASKDEAFSQDTKALVASSLTKAGEEEIRKPGQEGADRLGASGERIVAYEDGSSYTGQLVEGVREGYGIWKSSSASYQGNWVRGRQDGHGNQTWTDGRTYEGQFSEGQFHGKGLMTWITLQGNMTYEGEYRNDVKHGHGRFKWPDGRVYDGGWIDGQRSGEGSYVNLRGEVRQGIWTDDRFERWIDSGEEGELQFSEEPLRAQET